MTDLFNFIYMYNFTYDSTLSFWFVIIILVTDLIVFIFFLVFLILDLTNKKIKKLILIKEFFENPLSFIFASIVGTFVVLLTISYLRGGLFLFGFRNITSCDIYVSTYSEDISIDELSQIKKGDYCIYNKITGGFYGVTTKEKAEIFLNYLDSQEQQEKQKEIQEKEQKDALIKKITN